MSIRPKRTWGQVQLTMGVVITLPLSLWSRDDATAAGMVPDFASFNAVLALRKIAANAALAIVELSNMSVG
jgi:hypothetical protein